MEPKVVKRRGSGRPNRGGGRQRGRGRGGRGRGSHPQPAPQSRGAHQGHGGRKGGANLVDDDDYNIYNDEDDELELKNLAHQQTGGHYQQTGGHYQQTGGQHNFINAGPSSVGVPRGAPRGRGKRFNPVKVTMQQLRMSSDNQDMVKDMLKELHGNDLELRDVDEYDELDHRAENQYWVANNQLNLVEDTIIDQSEDPLEVSSLAVNKLSRYGFHKKLCGEALQACEGDLGMALEYLLGDCFELHIGIAVTSDDTDSITETRNDEMFALQAIYEDKFHERIHNHVWVLNLNLPRLDSLTKPKREDKKKPTWAAPSAEVCRFYSRGFCKFGRRCRMVHSKPGDKRKDGGEDDEKVSESEYEIEIRFPDGCLYPHEAPFIAFSTTSWMEKHICLNITKHLVNKAKEMAEMSEPSVFTVVSMLEDEAFLEEVVKEAPHEFSCAVGTPAWKKGGRSGIKDRDAQGEDLSDVTDADTDSNLDETEKAMINMAIQDSLKAANGDETVVKSRTMSGEQVKVEDPRERMKVNRRLIEDYKKKQSSTKYQKMLKSREHLPAWKLQDDILRVLDSHQVVVISGMTGCGKTTQVPQFILDYYLSCGDVDLCNILCTQPRRISAIAVAERVSDERAEALGRSVGYQIRLEKVMSSSTRLLFCTTGIVLRRLEGDTTLTGVTHLIIDEVHERSEESDFLLMYLRDMLPRRPDLKVLLMSATLNAQLFAEYFGGCAIVEIPGRTFPVDQYFLEDAIEFTRFVIEESSPYARPVKHMNAVRKGIGGEEEEDENVGSSHRASDRVQDQNLSVKQLYLRYTDYHKATVRSLSMMDHTKINLDLILELLSWLVTADHSDLEFPSDGAILIFMPGFAEIQQLLDMIWSSPVFGHQKRRKYRIIPLHSTLSSEDQKHVFSQPPEGVTKIVIATNIAETSITIDDVCFVIDTGKMKEKRYDPSKGMESLDTVWVSQANSLQRKGRAGRVKSGVCFHLFTSHRYEHHLLKQPVPEMRRVPLEQIVLRIRMLHIFRTMPVQSVLDGLPEPPDQEAISAAVERLVVLGALEQSGDLTPLGYHLGCLPVDVRIGKLMLLGAIFRCLDPALTIAASLSSKSPFVTPFGKKHEANERKLEFTAGNSDHLTMVNAYNDFTHRDLYLALEEARSRRYSEYIGWLEAKQKSGQEAYLFCQENFLSQRSLQMLASMKQQFVELLSDIGFVREGISARDVERAARRGSDGVLSVTGEEANINAENRKLVSAILVGALFPNVVQVLTPEQTYAQTGGGTIPVAPKAEDIRFKTKPDGYVSIHPSSVNFQVRYFESPYLVYHEKVKTTKIYIRDCTMVSVYPLLLFGGGTIEVELSRGNFLLSVDQGWIRVMAASHQVAELMKEIRVELDSLLADKIETPHMDLCSCPRGSKIINTIVKLVTTQ